MLLVVGGVEGEGFALGEGDAEEGVPPAFGGVHGFAEFAVSDPLDVDGGAVDLVYPVGVLFSQKTYRIVDSGGHWVFPLVYFQCVDVAALEVEEFCEVALAHAEHSPDQA